MFKFRYLKTLEEIRSHIDLVNRECPFVVCDTETTGLDVQSDRVVEIQLSGVSENEVVMFDGKFLPELLSLTVPVVFWHMRYDLKVCYFNGVDLRHLENRDAMLLDHLIDENRPHDLDSHIQRNWQDDYKERFWNKYENYQEATFEDRLDYACRDIYYTRRLYSSFVDTLQGKEKLQEHVHRLAKVLLDTEIRGVKVDLDFTVQMGTDLKSDIVKTEAELRTLGGAHCDIIELDLWLKEIRKRKTTKGKLGVKRPEFNFSSSAQVMSLLYEELKLPVQNNPKTKKPTVDDAALKELDHRHPLIPEIRKLRKYTKMYSAFVDGVLTKERGGRIYPSFNVNGTKTGRISHSEPNLGQIPSKDEWAKIRGIFTPEKGNKLISCDYGQLEVCIAAHFSGDENLLKIINEGLSQHDITSQGLGVPRPIAKTLNFGMQYLCSPFKVAEVMGCSKKKAEEVWHTYWKTYQGLKDFIDWCISELDAGRPIVNPFGRARHFPGFKRPSWSDPKSGMFCKEDRQCFNAIIQGTGADITSRALYLIGEELKLRGWGYVWFSIHDEVLAEVKEEYVSDARKLIQDVMVGVGEEIKLNIPLSVDCSQGLDRWEK